MGSQAVCSCLLVRFRRRAEERRLQEDTILKQMEEDEIRAAEKERPHRETSDDDDTYERSDFENSSRIINQILISLLTALLLI